MIGLGSDKNIPFIADVYFKNIESKYCQSGRMSLLFEHCATFWRLQIVVDGYLSSAFSALTAIVVPRISNQGLNNQCTFVRCVQEAILAMQSEMLQLPSIIVWWCLVCECSVVTIIFARLIDHVKIASTNWSRQHLQNTKNLIWSELCWLRGAGSAIS